MLAKGLAAFFAALIVTVASVLTFEEKPSVEQLFAPPQAAAPAVVAAPVPISPPVKLATKPIPHAQKKVPRVVLALAPVRVIENAPQPQTPKAQLPQAHVAELGSGTNLFVQLGEKLSARDNYAGETFRGTLQAPIIWKDFIIADRGSKVLGRIVGTDKQHLRLTLTEINTTDGQRVDVKTNVLENGGRLAFQLTDPLTLTEKLKN